MDQDAQIVTVDAEIAADLIFVALFEKNPANDAAVALRHLCHNLTNLFFHLLVGHRLQNIYARIGKLFSRSIFEGRSSGRSPVLFQ